MFATVSFMPPQVESLLVPASALLMNNDTTTVFVETKPWTFIRRTIEPGSDIEGQVEVLGGLTAGERIVVKGGVLLND
jgi:cobalt-zinc-cadmium efflux system membrane fusion protein